MGDLLGIFVIAIYLIFFLIEISIYAFQIFVSIVKYLVQSLAEMKIAKKLDIANGWLAFIPGANIFLLGKFAEKDDEINNPSGKRRKWSKLLVIAYIVFSALLILALTLNCIVGFIFGLLSGVTAETGALSGGFVIIMMLIILLLTGLILLLFAAYSALMYYADYKLFRLMANKENAWWMLLLDILLPISRIVILVLLGFSKRYPLYMSNQANAQEPIVGEAEEIKEEQNA